jgi:hypothetical protein
MTVTYHSYPVSSISGIARRKKLAAPNPMGPPARKVRRPVVAAPSLTQRRRLIVITTDELQAVAETDALLLLIKTKLCDLAVKGTIP